MVKGQLRHIAISVPDKEKTAKFYEETFGFKRVSESVVATRLTDGVVNLTFLQFRNQDDAGDERGKDFVGIHHFGIWVDGLEGTRQEIEANGGRYHWSERNSSGECRAQIPGSERHRLRYLNAWMGRREAIAVESASAATHGAAVT